MINVSIFENEYISVKGAFEAANFIRFNKELSIKQYPSSQSANLKNITSDDVIFVDIDLSQKSDLDGFGLISKLIEHDPDSLKKVIILTGNNKIKESLEEQGISIPLHRIVIKPTDYEIIGNSIDSVLSGK